MLLREIQVQVRKRVQKEARIWTHTCTYKPIKLNLYAYICVFIHMYPYLYIFQYVYVNISIYTCIYIFMRICFYEYIQVVDTPNM